MNKYKHVCVLKGGWSSEREVSLVSGAAVANGLRDAGYQVSEIDVKPDISEVLKALKPDVVFNGLHGTWGEDGCVQGILETLKIPYTHSGVKASALAMDKILSKKLFKSVGIACAQDKIVSIKELFENEPMARPFVVKPYNDGSSVGVVIVMENDQFSEDQDGPWKNTDHLMVEKYIPGRELTVSVMGDRVLCVTELKPKKGFYDYKAKYQDGMTDHILPADLSEEHYNSLMEMALKAHNILGCRGVSRSDFRMDEDDTYILETNTQPGMTPLSLLPEQAKYSGIGFSELVTWMVEDASCER
ncbi:MAG: D-alanine--D-alanine ligase [Kordiimonadaceae bacterium]|jgi:D-alanine-D-alanine ligase|nr:D-alanine--D-alanine ligase [Kordiimonadaceae bacterium]MBT6036453.1 D-alanine--D-alanine ligase [Kordiimonadaceae bacterium]MBT6330082.1 D-alanine--D-alanine ligase [Kordiimonadaceae bacterium]MBT7582111.1 D-alanine--D-alanine ligase [Kordiimonadaceae bacterium]